MTRALTQKEYAALDARRKQSSTVFRIVALIVPVEVLLVFLALLLFLDLGAISGLLIALIVASIALVPLLMHQRIKTRIEHDLHSQMADEHEGIVEKIAFGKHSQFASVLVSGQRFQIPIELAQTLRMDQYVRVAYAQKSRIILSVSP